MGRVALKASTLDIRELFPDITRGRHHGRHFHGEIPHDGRSCQAKWSTCSSPLLYYPRFVQCARVAKGIGVNGNERLSQGWNDAKAEARWLCCYLFAFFLLSYACHENQSRKISSITPLDFVMLHINPIVWSLAILGLVPVGHALPAPAPQAASSAVSSGSATSEAPSGPTGLRGSSDLLGTNGEPILTSNSAIVKDYQYVHGQSQDKDLGLYLDFTSVPNPQPIRGTHGATDPGPSRSTWRCRVVTEL
jgi:hypothetical protein